MLFAGQSMKASINQVEISRLVFSFTQDTVDPEHASTEWISLQGLTPAAAELNSKTSYKTIQMLPDTMENWSADAFPQDHCDCD